MLKLFEYNWQVRKEWFDWCGFVAEEELLKKRTGGAGSILYTLFHIVECEHSWISALQGKPMPPEPPFEDYAALPKVSNFAASCHAEIAPFIYAWDGSMETRVLLDRNVAGEWESFKYGEIMWHVLAHEIHHMGQLSIWSRELGRPPISSNVIRRGLFDT